MATTKIQQGAIASDAITSADLGDDITLSGDYVKVPVGNTANRPSGASAGYIRFNTTEGTLEQYDGSAWSQMPKPPIISTLSYPGSASAVSPDGGDVVTISGSNFETGVNVYFRSSTYTATYATSVTRNSSTSLSVTTPALTAGDYDVIVEQADGTQAILTSGLTSNAAPSFSTASGSLGSINNDAAITKITIVASEADSGDIVYTVTTGSLPTGLSLDSSADSAGTISGTPTGYSTETTVNFTITATDDENQTTTRDFSLTVLVIFYDYEISQSVRFNDGDSPYLSWTPSSAGNRQTWTYSFWAKRGTLNSSYQFFTSALQSAAADDNIGFMNDDTFRFRIYDGGATIYDLTTTQVFRDTSSWYHFVCLFDSTQSTSSDRMKLYVNGAQITTFSTSTYPSQNYYSTGINSTNAQNIGRYASGSYYFDGYLAEVNFIDGQALDSSYFGETKNGVWIPKEYTGTYGTNGFYLDFSNPAVAYGEDQSGNNNDFTDSNFNVTDKMLDTPTNNFATWNPLNDFTGSTFRQGNLRTGTTDSGLYGWTTSTIAPSSGKWYCELYCVANTTSDKVGIAKTSATLDGSTATGFVRYNRDGGTIDVDGTSNATGATFGAGDIIGIAADLDNGSVTFYKNGVSQGSSGTFTVSGEYYIGIISDGRNSYSSNWSVNFGQDSSFEGAVTAQGNQDDNDIGDFYYTPPSGYLALCNENLPNNTIPSPSDHFNVVTYTGNGTSQDITGLDFQPDFVWIKERSNTSSHMLFDAVRGVGKYLRSNLTDAEGSNPSGTLTAFNSDGFNVNASTLLNESSETYVAWCWKAGGTPVSNTDGSITSSVSANTTAGFSIVSYTGNATAGATVGHGLSSAPEMIVIKDRDAIKNWIVYHASNGNDYSLYLNDTASLVGSTDHWNYTTPTSSVFSLGNYSHVNTTDNYIAYCFHSVEGYSKIGTYTGNGSFDGTFIYTGFNPRFIMMKRTDSTNRWVMMDSERDNPNEAFTHLWANQSDAEVSNDGETAGYDIDFLSNGFKQRNNNASSVSDTNKSGGTYIYMAFAEDPFKYGNAR